MLTAWLHLASGLHMAVSDALHAICCMLSGGAHRLFCLNLWDVLDILEQITS